MGKRSCTMENLVDQSLWKGRSVFVTGHTGFIGSWLALWLNDLGAEVHGYALSPPTKTNLFEIAGVSEALFTDTRADIRDAERLSAVLKEAKPDIILHLAAQPLVRDSYRMPVDTFATNIMGTVNLLEAARIQPSVQAILVVTSDKCYANDDQGRAFKETDPLGGHDPYSASKACAELVSAAYERSFFAPEVTVATARAGNIIGGGDWAGSRLVPDCVRAVMSGQAVVLRYPQATRPWQHVLDAVSGYLVLGQKLLQYGAEYAGPWNFGPSPDATATVEEVASTVMGYLGGKVRVSDQSSTMDKEAILLQLDSTKAANELGWASPWSLERSLEETAAWYASWRSGLSMPQVMLDDIKGYLAS